jgi:cyclin B
MDQENPVAGKKQTLTRQTGRSALGQIQNRVANNNGGGIVLEGKKKSLVELPEKKVTTKAKPSLANVQAKVDSRRPRTTRLQSSTSSSQVAEEQHQSKKQSLLIEAGPQKQQQQLAPVLPSIARHDESSHEMEVVDSPRKDAPSGTLSNVVDIDADDWDAPFLLSEYVNDIYIYLRHLENQQTVRDNYLHWRDGQKPAVDNGITGKMRQILVDWLFQVHTRFSLLSETMYMTVALIDRYLQERPSTTKDKLQLVGVTAMLLASKYEEIYAPEINDFVYITDKCYTAHDIQKMEIDMLKVLQFDIGRPLPIHFLRRYSKANSSQPEKHNMAKFIMELCLVDYSMVGVKPSLVAAAALYLINLMTGDEPWPNTVSYYSRYSAEDVRPTVTMVAQVIQKAFQAKNKLQAVKNKYATVKNGEVSKMSCFTGPVISDLVAVSASS